MDWGEYMHNRPEVLVAVVKTSLEEIAKQAAALGAGLQNVAPGVGTPNFGAPNNSISYLLAIADLLFKISSLCVYDHHNNQQASNSPYVS